MKQAKSTRRGFSHSQDQDDEAGLNVVWAAAMVGLALGREIVTEQIEGWLLVASGVIILGIALWMLWRTG
jgi:ABC-type nickel/cobalt efflux system permease component RcnA